MPSTPSQNERSVRFRKWALGFLVLGAVLRWGPVSFSTALFTNSSQSTASIGSAVDWTPPTVDIVDPGEAIRGTVTITMTAADGETGVKNVVLAWAPTGTTTFTTICTDTSSPYSCSFNTTGITEQDIDLRAIATDNTNYTATDLIEAITIDNTQPTVSVSAPSGTLTGVVTISASAADAGSGVATVDIQRSVSGLNSWTSLCVDSTTPYSCQFDTTTVSDGLYDFRAIATDYAGNTRTSTLVSGKLVSNIAPSVSVNDPGAFIRGTVTITANANATGGITSVRIDRAPNGTTNWTALCTDTTSPYSCTFDTTTVADGLYVFRAVATTTLQGTVTSATVGPSQVDNTVVRGYDVQATNGATVGKIASTDTLAVTYTKAMNLTTILSGWTGASTNVVVRVRDGAVLGLTNVDDTIDVFTSSNLNTAVNLGSVNLKGNFVKGGKTVTMNATMVASTVVVNGANATKVTITIGTALTQGGSLRTASTTPVVMQWSPSAIAKDLTGAATSTAATAELGTNDRDF